MACLEIDKKVLAFYRLHNLGRNMPYNIFVSLIFRGGFLDNPRKFISFAAIQEGP